MTGTPQISVVIPVWDDYARWLPSALESLGDQGVAITVIVVDNASTTAVPAAARATMLRLDRRLSVGAARNAGLAAVSTPFVCFLDVDDVLLPGALARMRARLAARPSAVVAVAGCDAWIEATGETSRPLRAAAGTRGSSQRPAPRATHTTVRARTDRSRCNERAVR